MSERDEFWEALFPAEDLAAMRHEAAKAEIEDRMLRERAEFMGDPALAWRTALAEACTAEGVSYLWDLEAEVTRAFAPGHHPINVPDPIIDDLREQGAHPAAVACHLKAVSIDPRFASWDDEEASESL